MVGVPVMAEVVTVVVVAVQGDMEEVMESQQNMVVAVAVATAKKFMATANQNMVEPEEAMRRKKQATKEVVLQAMAVAATVEEAMAVAHTAEVRFELLKGFRI
jgi:ribosomal protein L12E/L44/L45/RPP1/RPP2